MIELRRAAQRFRTRQPGIESWHSLSAGAHYDPANVSFGALVGVDEHLVDPGAGFDWHMHNGVRIVSYVLAGTLRHEDMAGVTEVGTGEVLPQEATSATRHAERNASRTEPLRIVQMTVLAGRAAAQSVSSGTIEGLVKDESGGVLPGATVTLTSPQLQVGQTVQVSDSAGTYKFVDLPAGTYRLKAELTGFPTSIASRPTGTARAST